MYDELKKQAQDAANTYAKTLQQLIDSQNQQKLLSEQAASQRYQNLINQINQQRQPIQQQFEADSQTAYINKMLAGKQINQTLNQLGLNTQGFGVSQQAANETAYGQNINQLLLSRNQAYQNLDNQITNITGEYNASRSELEATYAQRLADLQKYIAEATQNYYNTTYSQLLSARQYQDQLAQQAWQRTFSEKQLAEQKRATNLQYESTPTFDDRGTKTNQIETDYYKGSINPDTQHGTFGTTDKYGTKYQPNNINGVPLKSSGKKVYQMAGGKGNKNSSGVNVDNQTVWKIGNNYYIWNGSKNKYEQVVFD